MLKVERVTAYASDEEIANKLREKILTLPDNHLEELKTLQGGVKFEFYGTMLDGVSLMGLGASCFAKMT